MGNPRHRQVNPLHGVTELTSEPEQSVLRPQPSGKSHFASSTLCPLESEHRQLSPNPDHLSRSPPVPPLPDPVALLSAPRHFLSPLSRSMVVSTGPVVTARPPCRWVWSLPHDCHPWSTAPRRPPLSSPRKQPAQKHQAMCRLSAPIKRPLQSLPCPPTGDTRTPTGPKGVNTSDLGTLPHDSFKEGERSITPRIWRHIQL